MKEKKKRKNKMKNQNLKMKDPCTKVVLIWCPFNLVCRFFWGRRVERPWERVWFPFSYLLFIENTSKFLFSHIYFNRHNFFKINVAKKCIKKKKKMSETLQEVKE